MRAMSHIYRLANKMATLIPAEIRPVFLPALDSAKQLHTPLRVDSMPTQVGPG